MPNDWRITKKAKRIMSLLNSVFGNNATPLAQNTMQSSSGLLAQGAIAGAQLTHNQQAWNAAQQGSMMASYPYTNSSYRALHLIVKQVENGYTVEIGGSTHIASDLKEITDLLTNRVAATLLEWNP
jgi:hypothetical protein